MLPPILVFDGRLNSGIVGQITLGFFTVSERPVVLVYVFFRRMGEQIQEILTHLVSESILELRESGAVAYD